MAVEQRDEPAGQFGPALAVARHVGGAQCPPQQSLAIQTFIAPREGDDPDPDRKPSETTTRTP